MRERSWDKKLDNATQADTCIDCVLRGGGRERKGKDGGVAWLWLVMACGMISKCLHGSCDYIIRFCCLVMMCVAI